MIDLKNSYIENDQGPLFRAWLKEANAQGLNPKGQKAEWFSNIRNQGYCLIHGSGENLYVNSVSRSYTCGLTELTLKDFEPKNYKCVPVAYGHFWELAKAYQETLLCHSYCDGQGRTTAWYNTIGERINCIEGLVQAHKSGGVYTREPVQWYENITKPVICWVWDAQEHKRKYLTLIVAKYPDSSHPFLTQDSTRWKHAEPIKPEELLQID